MSQMDADGLDGAVVASSTVYIGGVYELHSDGSAVKYYAAMGQTVAMRTVPAGGGQGTLLWPLHDHLGSTVAVTDSTGAVLSRQDYWPYGSTRSVQTYVPVTETDKLYTGQQQQSGDPALGLYNYRARFYSTTLGRFVSADTVPDGLNRYAYVHGNPLRFDAPTGHGVTGGGDLDEGYCPSNNSNCFADGTGATGGNGGPDNHYDNGGNTCGTYQCMLADPNCNDFCQGMAACALGAGDCGGSAGGGSSVVPVVAGVAAVGGVATFAESAGVCEAVTGGGCTPIVVVGGAVVACYLVCKDAARAIGHGLTTLFGKSDAQKKPGTSGSFKGTDALRRENKQANDAARTVGLNKDQERELHDEITGQGYDYPQILEIARQIKKGNK